MASYAASWAPLLPNPTSTVWNAKDKYVTKTPHTSSRHLCFSTAFPWRFVAVWKQACNPLHISWLLYLLSLNQAASAPAALSEMFSQTHLPYLLYQSLLSLLSSLPVRTVGNPLGWGWGLPCAPQHIGCPVGALLGWMGWRVQVLLAIDFQRLCDGHGSSGGWLSSVW